MGIRELSKFIETCGKIVPYNEYAGQYIAIDAFQCIYKYCCNKVYMDPQIKFNGHIRAILNCSNNFINHGIVPIFIFDGSSIAIKVKNKASNDTQNQYEQHHANNFKQRQFKISPQQIKECEKILECLGIPHIRAPFEADSQCAALMTKKSVVKVRTVMSEDTDTLVFGAMSMIRCIPYHVSIALEKLFKTFNATNSDREPHSICEMIDTIGSPEYDILRNKLDIHIKYDRKMLSNMIEYGMSNFIIRYHIDDVLSFLKEATNKILTKNNRNTIDTFTHKNFVDMCILFGSDYLPRATNEHAIDIFERFVLFDMDIPKYTKNVFIEGEHHVIRDATNSMNLSEHNTCEKLVCNEHADDVNQMTHYISNVNSVNEYYMNASVIDPNTIDVTLYRPMKTELYECLKKQGFTNSFITNTIRTYEYGFCRIAK